MIRPLALLTALSISLSLALTACIPEGDGGDGGAPPQCGAPFGPEHIPVEWGGEATALPGWLRCSFYSIGHAACVVGEDEDRVYEMQWDAESGEVASWYVATFEDSTRAVQTSVEVFTCEGGEMRRRGGYYSDGA